MKRKQFNFHSTTDFYYYGGDCREVNFSIGDGGGGVIEDAGVILFNIN